jgi:hypothetical protein
MHESSLHARLKAFYTQDGGFTEMWVDGYLVDVVKGQELIEIQTGNFSHLKTKLEQLLIEHKVRLVLPIAREKLIILKDSEYALISRRRSPKKGRIEDLFYDLVYISNLVAHPNFSLEVLLTSEEEERVKDGNGSWRRGGVRIADRRLVSILERIKFSNVRAYQTLIPNTMGDNFTNQELAQHLGISLRLASKMTYCLCRIGMLEKKAKRGRAFEFSSL